MIFEEPKEPPAGETLEQDSLESPAGDTDKTRGTYAKHGVFSRSPWKALARCGEDMKKLGQTERLLYQQFRPRTPLEELLLDRAWSCVLPCALIGREEQRIFAAASKPTEERIREISPWANALGCSKLVTDQTSGVLNELARILRYDAYYAKEFLRCIGTLVGLQNGEHPAGFSILNKVGNTGGGEN